jgi:two-component system chemotaxis response regulator CheB
MSDPTIVAIGASAGGLPALQTVLAGLPPDFPAAIFVVMHLSPTSVSHLADVLNRAGPLPVTQAVNGEPIAPGHVYVAPPDRHLLVRHGWVDVSRGPRENRSRPAIDPLFRSAARAYGNRVIGVILSGALYDGAAGLLAIEARGGTTVVQHPQDAAIGSMPLSALRMVDADYILPAADIAPILAQLVQQETDLATTGATMAEDEPIEKEINKDFVEQADDERDGETSVFTCPDCGGVLWQAGAGNRLWFRCHVGHAYAPEVLLGLMSDELEAALWTCVRLLRERSTLSSQLAARPTTGAEFPHVTERLDEQAVRDEQYVARIRELLDAFPTPGELIATPEVLVEEDRLSEASD